jgi:predicted aspartyl protease
MGFVRLGGLIGPDESDLHEVTFLVDIGSFYTILTPGIVAAFHLQTTTRGPVVLADSRIAQIPLGMAYLRLSDREGGVPVGVVQVPEPMLGVTALEALGLKVNPVDGTLEHARPFGPAALALCGHNG